MINDYYTHKAALDKNNVATVRFGAGGLIAGAKIAFFTIMILCFTRAFCESAPVGSFADTSPKDMAAVLELDAKLNPADDEFVVYYVRKDHDYKKWALWIWANPGGDGQANFKYTQNWLEDSGIGYMRLKLDGSSTGGAKIASAAGDIGFIVRHKDAWSKDGKEDRLWNINTAKRVAVFSGDGKTYAAAPYKPSIENAEFVTEKEIAVKLSGKYALDPSGANCGFIVKTDDGKEYPITKVFNTQSPKDLAQNYTKNVTIQLGEGVSISEKLSLNNEAFLGSAKISTVKLAVSIADSMTPAADEKLGCIYKDGAASFKIWAPTSSTVVLNLYSGATGTASSTTPMTMDAKTGVWSANVACTDGTFYDYTVTNSKGTQNVLDPYALSMSANKGDGAIGRAAVIDMESDKAGVKSTNYAKLSQREDAIIYEISVRDFTISADSAVTGERGTYNAFIEKIPYLKELGITHVQLMPVLNFFFNDETNKKYEDSGKTGGNNYNWGYDPHNYFTAEGWYSSDASDPYCRIKELRALIDACHKAGIGVLLDVVYNHMATTQFLDDIVPGYYFRTNDNGSFKANSGCGNDVASERKMVRKLIVDSCAHWVSEYGADGFRFDLMGLIEANAVEDAYKACAKINRATLFEGEGWKMYNGVSGTVGMDQNYMTKTNNVAVFNDELRDLIKAGGFNETGRGFITKKETDADRFFANVTGSPIGNYRADDPGDNLNYLVCHDGLTLHDAVTNNLQLDESKDKSEIISRIKLGNFIVLTSQGIAFLHGGQERGRTKPNPKGEKNECVGKFVRNSYDSSDNINQFVWTLDSDYEGLLEYTKSLISLRKGLGVLRLGDAKKVSKAAKMIDTKDPSGLVMAYTIKDGKDKYIIAINAKTEQVRFNAGLKTDGALIYVDKNTANVNGVSNPQGVEVSGKSVTLDPLTATIIRAK